MLKGKRVLVTAGPTKELIDPVRFISNSSSGKMGYAIANALVEKGAEVILVSGPTDLKINAFKCKVIPVTTALEMLRACQYYYSKIDAAVFSAAVADYRPLAMEQSKIKKKTDTLTLELTKNPDIAFEFGKVKKANQISIGFALETDNLLEYGKDKMKRKKFDFIVLNKTGEEGQGFGYDTNKVSVLFKDESVKSFPMKSKNEIAFDIANEMCKLFIPVTE